MSPEQAGMPQAFPVPPKPLDGPPPKVLVVDDNEDILNLIQRILVKQSYRIFTAVNGIMALEVARREMPDLILLDVMLPEKDGLSVCKELKADPATRGIMILLVTGRGSIDHRAEGLDAGADDYIPKPFHITELLARVRSSLRIKRLTDELRDRNRQLVESQRDRLRSEKMATIGLLATGLAHEFNNIMSGISGYAQLARKNPKFRDQLIDVTLTQSERALELTRSLSTFYRPSAGKQPVQLEKVVENALCLVAKQLQEHSITVEKRLAGIPQVLGSAGQLQEVVLNLVINAIHAIHAEGRIEIILETEGSTVRLTVRDNGCGIPPENLDRIFDPFFTTKGALGGGSVGGSGLGLSISYNIVNAHSGTIQVQSEPGKGTTFTITLPAMAAGAGAGDPQGPGAGAVMESTGREILAGVAPVMVCESVLVGDTEEAVQEMIVQYLGARETVGARSWSEIQDACRSRSHEFLILDLELPGLPGLPEALEAIGSSSPDTQIIITSRSIPDPGLQKILRKARGHLLKPYTIENLAGIMSSQPQMHPTV